MPNDNIRPLGRCCDCRYLGVMPDGGAECEGPIPDVYQPERGRPLSASEIMRVRRCDCYEKKEATDGES